MPSTFLMDFSTSFFSPLHVHTFSHTSHESIAWWLSQARNNPAKTMSPPQALGEKMKELVKPQPMNRVATHRRSKVQLSAVFPSARGPYKGHWCRRRMDRSVYQVCSTLPFSLYYGYLRRFKDF
jgi:hypothetical protein